MNELTVNLITLIVRVIIAAAAVLLSRYVLPMIKESGVYGKISKLASAAEKLAENWNIDKKAYVIDMLRENNVKITPYVEAMIEAAVSELDRAKAAVNQQ